MRASAARFRSGIAIGPVVDALRFSRTFYAMFPRLRLAFFTLSAGVSLAISSRAATPGRPVTLEECLQRAIEKNLSLRIARYDPRLASLGVHAAYANYDPTFYSSAGQTYLVTPQNSFLDPSKFTPNTTTEKWNDLYSFGIGGLTPSGLTYSLDANLDRTSVYTIFSPTNKTGSVIRNSGYSDGASLNLRQPLLKNFWIDGTRLNIALAKNALQQSEESLRAALFDLCSSVAQNYYDLIGAEENIALQTTALSMAERLLVENRHRVEIGSLAPLSEKQAEAQAEARRSDLISAREHYDHTVNALNALITDDLAQQSEAAIESVGGLDTTPEVLNRQDSWHKALTYRPDIRQEKLSLASRQVSLKYDRNQLFPQLDLMGSYGLAGNQLQFGSVLGDVADRVNPQFSYGIELRFPLSNRQARDRLKADRMQLERQLLQFKRLEQAAMREVNDLIFAVNAAQARLATTKATQAFAEAALQAEQSKLSFGTSSSFNVLQLQRDLVSAQVAYIQSRVDFRKSLIRLAQAEGTLLEQLRINLSVQ